MSHTPVRILRLCACLASVALSVGRAPASPEKPVPDGWRALIERRFNEAGPEFVRALSVAPQDRSLIVGQAVALLAKQPRTQGNVAEAESLLASVEDGTDEAAISARYLRARVAEVHLFEPDYPRAAERYEALIAAVPEHPVAQAAMVKLLRLRVYYLAADPITALRDAESWGERFTDAGARRDYHVIMARSLIFFGQDRARALVHLRAAERAGFVLSGNEADALVAVGELARELGDSRLARESFNRFLERHPRDQRRHFVQTLLATMPVAEVPRP